MTDLPYLPIEIREKIISMVDDIDIRRYFRVYNKIDITKYKILEKIFPTRIYAKWACRSSNCDGLASGICHIHKHPYNFNPIINPIAEKYSTNPIETIHYNSMKDKMETILRSHKTIGPYKHYHFIYDLPNHIEGEYRENNGGGCDMMEIDISEFNESVVYEIGIWKVKKKTGENMKENKNMYHMGSLSTKEYFTDFVEYSYELNTLRYPDYCYFR